MNIKNKLIENISIDELKSYLLEKGFKPNNRIIFSLDCDRTIVNRAISSHFVSDEVITVLSKLKFNPSIITVINTGRDITSYNPLENMLGELPGIYLSGRVIKYNNNIEVINEGIIEESLKNKLWELFSNNIIPFLDIKHKNGAIYFAYKNRNLEQYLGHHRPLDWFDLVKKNIIYADENEEAYKLYNDLVILRAEIPFIEDYVNNTFNITKEKNFLSAKDALYKLLNLPQEYPLHFSMLTSPKTRTLDNIVTIKLLFNNHYVNKGLGLKIFAEELGVNGENIFSFGDSADLSTNDCSIKDYLPGAHLFITEDGDEAAKSVADYIISSVINNGVPKAIEKILRAIS
ncbi:MAG: HAD hydrolase family protein [Sphingobacteriia bacterium]|nr:HAD hydrolase family protein [Sphingobacteriia bacterium]